MKKIFLIAILYWFSSNIFSQNLNYEYYINNNKLLHCNKMITTQDGGYIIVGANSANSSSAQTDYLDGFIMKLSSTGLVLWTTNITNNLSDVNRHEAIYDIIQLTDGSYVACGNAIVDNSILNDDNNSGRRGFLIHVSNTGSIINSKLFTATDHPFGISSNVYPSSKFSKIIQIPNTNDFIISGTFERFTTIMRINATSNDFNVVWSKIINYWYLNINPAIITDGSNGFIISTGFGSFYSFDYNGTLLARNKFDYSNVDFYDNLDMAWYKDKLAVTARTTGGMILFSLDRSLNLSNAIPPVLINATNGHNVGSNHRLLSNGNLLKIIGTEGYYDATLSKNVIRPILINYNNGNILAKGVKNGYFGSSFSASYYYARDGINIIPYILNKDNSTLIAFNSADYNLYNSLPQKINIEEINTDILESCNTINININSITYLLNLRDLTEDIIQPFNNYSITSNYLIGTTLPTIIRNDLNCTPCTSPELIRFGDFEDRTNAENFLRSWPIEGTQWAVPTNNTYTYTNSCIRNNTFFGASVVGAYNISNPIHNNNVWMVDFQQASTSPPTHVLPKTIWSQNVNISEIGTYNFCFDFGSINIGPGTHCGTPTFIVEIRDLATNNIILSNNYTYNGDGIGNCGGGSSVATRELSASIFMGFKDYCINVPINSIGNYRISLTLVKTTNHYNDYAFDNFSLKKLCGTCAPHSGRMAKPEINSNEEKFISLSELTVYPNPTNTNINLKFGLETDAKANLYIMDYLGRNIATVINNEQLTQGQQNYNIDVSQYANGIYIAILEIDGKRSLQKFVVQH